MELLICVGLIAHIGSIKVTSKFKLNALKILMIKEKDIKFDFAVS